MHKRMSPHGDYDHMGEAEMLVENYKVNTVIFNTGKYNYLEKGSKKVLKWDENINNCIISRLAILLLL